jgi:membrane protein implicated in regulation of membrane protease activity
MIEKIKDLNWHYQLILLVVIATLLYLTVWYFFTSVTRAEVQVLDDEIAQLTKNE